MGVLRVIPLRRRFLICEGNVKSSIALALIVVPYILADLREIGSLDKSNHKPPCRPRTLRVHEHEWKNLGKARLQPMTDKVSKPLHHSFSSR